jgi:hypothetical protein
MASGVALGALGRSWLVLDVWIRSRLLGGDAATLVPILGVVYVVGGLIAVL